jgi:acyl-CoA synthetase (AMP-forming)/AMP-acid ligase II
MGIRKGDRVAVHLPNTPHAVIAYYGILRANAVVVAMDPMASVDGLKALLADSGCRVMVTLTSALQKIRGIQETPPGKVIALRYRDYLPEKNPPCPSHPPVDAEPVDPSVRNWQESSTTDGSPGNRVGPDDPA